MNQPIPQADAAAVISELTETIATQAREIAVLKAYIKSMAAKMAEAAKGDK